MDPKVSVLVVAYNQERYIRAALEGIFAQVTSFPFEVIVADDGSTDGTRNVVERFALAYPDQLRLSYREANVGDGGNASYLQGLQMCRGEYIATLDGDDFWTDPLKLQAQADFLDARPDYSMCFHDCTIQYEDVDRESWETHRFLPGEQVTTENLLLHAMVQTSTIMMRRRVADALRTSIPQVTWPHLLSDWFVGLVASCLGPVGYLDRVMSVYRQHAGGAFGALSRAEQWVKFINLCEQLEGVLGEKHRLTIEQGLCVRSYFAALAFEKERDFTNARKYLARALEGRPEWLEPYCTRYGVTGAELLECLRRRLSAYRSPLLFPLWAGFEQLKAELTWYRLRAAVGLHTHLRYWRREPLGRIGAVANPEASRSTPGLTWVHLTWVTAAVKAVDVRIGRPDGPLISHSGAAGRTKTGEWVEDGTVFFLQRADGAPFAREHTLGVARVRVKT